MLRIEKHLVMRLVRLVCKPRALFFARLLATDGRLIANNSQG
jgi:hypothetical protein